MKKVSLFKYLFWVYNVILFIAVAVKFTGSFSDLQMQIQRVHESRAMGIWNYNLTVFRTINNYVKYITNGFAFKNIIGNIIVFVPFGLLLPAAYDSFSKWYKTIAVSLSAILMIEGFQLVTALGYFDIDDIILNMIGCCIGYGIFIILRAYAHKCRK